MTEAVFRRRGSKRLRAWTNQFFPVWEYEVRDHSGVLVVWRRNRLGRFRWEIVDQCSGEHAAPCLAHRSLGRNTDYQDCERAYARHQDLTRQDVPQ